MLNTTKTPGEYHGGHELLGNVSMRRNLVLLATDNVEYSAQLNRANDVAEAQQDEARQRTLLDSPNVAASVAMGNMGAAVAVAETQNQDPIMPAHSILEDNPDAIEREAYLLGMEQAMGQQVDAAFEEEARAKVDAVFEAENRYEGAGA